MGQNLSASGITCGNIVGHQLISAVREGDLGLVQRMLQDDRKHLNNCLFYERQTVLHVAAAHGQLEVFQSVF